MAVREQELQTLANDARTDHHEHTSGVRKTIVDLNATETILHSRRTNRNKTTQREITQLMEEEDSSDNSVDKKHADATPDEVNALTPVKQNKKVARKPMLDILNESADNSNKVGIIAVTTSKITKKGKTKYKNNQDCK